MASGWLWSLGMPAIAAVEEPAAAPDGIPWWHPWLVPLLVLTGSVLFGWLVDRIVRTRLMRWAASTPWRGDDIIVVAGRGLIWLWVSLLGLHVAAGLAPLPERLHGLLDRAVEVAFIVSVTIALGRIATQTFALYSERMAFKGGASVVSLLIKMVLFTVSGLVILQTEGISITPVLTALGVGGLAVALALQDTLGNIFAGIHTLMAGQIRPGDFIKLDADNEGYVIDIGWRNTSVRTMANNVVVIPNKKLGESVVVNYSRPEPHLSLAVPIGVAYDSDLERVEQVLLAIGRELAVTTPGILAEPGPAVRFAAFADSSVEARLVLQVSSIETFYLVRHLVIKAVHARFRREDIAIAFPTRTIHVSGLPPLPPPAVPVPQPPTPAARDLRLIDAEVEPHG